MRILILTQWYLPEPQELLSDLAESLQQLGHEVTVLTGFPNWPTGHLYPGYRIRLWQREGIRGVPVIRVPLYPDHSLSAVRRTANFLSFAASMTVLGPWLMPHVDVIHAIYPPLTMGWVAWLLSRLRGIPFTCEIQDMWPETLRATGMLRNERALSLIGRFAKWVYHQAAAIRVISPGFRANLITKGVLPEKIHIISNWADTSFFRPVVPDLALAEELGLAGRFNIMYAGTIGLAQGIDVVLEAAVLLRDLPQIQFVLVGDGIELQRLRTEAAKRGIRNVRFLGRYPVTEMPRFYSLADVLFLHLRDDPLFRITVPHKVFTYLASGRPILAAISGDAAELVRCAQAGVVCAPSDPSALAHSVRAFYRLSPVERDALGANARRAAVDLYSREALVAQIGEMLTMAVESA